MVFWRWRIITYKSSCAGWRNARAGKEWRFDTNTSIWRCSETRIGAVEQENWGSSKNRHVISSVSQFHPSIKQIKASRRAFQEEEPEDLNDRTWCGTHLTCVKRSSQKVPNWVSSKRKSVAEQVPLLLKGEACGKEQRKEQTSRMMSSEMLDWAYTELSQRARDITPVCKRWWKKKT